MSETPLLMNDRLTQLSPAAGTTLLTGDFALDREDGLTVLRIRAGVTAPLTPDTDWSFPAGIGGGAGFVITLNAPSLAGDAYQLIGLQPHERLSDFSVSSGFSADKLDADFRNHVISLQELRRDVDRAHTSAYGAPGLIYDDIADGHFFKKLDPGRMVDAGDIGDVIEAQGYAAAALASQIAAAASEAQTGLDRTQTGLDRIQTGLDRVQTGLDRVQTGFDRTAADGFAAAAALSAASVAGQAVGKLAGRLPSMDFVGKDIQEIELGVRGGVPYIERIHYATGEQDDYTGPTKGLPVYHERAIAARLPSMDYADVSAIEVGKNNALISVTYASGKQTFLGGVGPAQVDAPMGVQMGIDPATGRAFTMGPFAGTRDLVPSGCFGVSAVPSWPLAHIVVVGQPGRGLASPYLIASDSFGRNPTKRPVHTLAHDKILAVAIGLHQSDGMTNAFEPDGTISPRYRLPVHNNLVMLANSRPDTLPTVACGTIRNSPLYAQQVLAAELTDIIPLYNFIPFGAIHGTARLEMAMMEEYIEGQADLPAMGLQGLTRLGLGGIGPKFALNVPPSSTYRIIPILGSDVGRDWTLRGDFDNAMQGWKNRAAANGWGVYLSDVPLWFSVSMGNDSDSSSVFQQVISEITADLANPAHAIYTGQPAPPLFWGFNHAVKFSEDHPSAPQQWHAQEALRNAADAGVWRSCGPDYGALQVDGFGYVSSPGLADGYHMVASGHAYMGELAREFRSWWKLGRNEKCFQADIAGTSRAGDVITVPVLGGFASGNPAVIDAVSISNRAGTVNGWRYMVGGESGTNAIASVAAAGGGGAYLITLNPGTGAGQLGYADFGHIAAGAPTAAGTARGQCRRQNGFTSQYNNAVTIYYWLEPFRKAMT